MQKLLFVIAVAALSLSSCGNKDKRQKEGTHTHSDGTVHEAHEPEAAPQQESFEVKSACDGCAGKDSCSEATESDHSKVHDHEGEHSHDHDHSHSH
ncbi:hypothetical protein DMA11_04070 [Marinilabiliaceae bacterium JC017]|nr:hypothetical protein DMA11_04070 [Marinilabiliaceae bacterium JC017]